MKVVSFVVIREGESVATNITGWVFLVNTRKAVEGLMDISQVVDQQAESVGLSVLFIFHLGHHCLINEAIFIARLFLNPGNNTFNGMSDVLVFPDIFREIIDGTALIEEGGVNEVPV